MMIIPLAITQRDLILVVALAAILTWLAVAVWASGRPSVSFRDRLMTLGILPLAVILAVVPAILASAGIWLFAAVGSLVLTPVPRPAVTAPAKPRDVPASIEVSATE